MRFVIIKKRWKLFKREMNAWMWIFSRWELGKTSTREKRSWNKNRTFNISHLIQSTRKREAFRQSFLPFKNINAIFLVFVCSYRYFFSYHHWYVRYPIFFTVNTWVRFFKFYFSSWIISIMRYFSIVLQKDELFVYTVWTSFIQYELNWR